MSTIDRQTFSNPVIPGFHPDPSICRVADTFYLVTSSFEYFPGIPIFASQDLVSWTQIGHCLTRASQLDLSKAKSSQGIYAPTIRWHDGRFYVTSTNVGGRGHFIVHTDDPTGEWSDPVWVDQNGIDPSLYFEDGVAYFQSNVELNQDGEHALEPDFQRGLQQSIVNPLTGERLTEPEFLWAGSGGRYPEAPHLFRRGDFYYLLAAEGGTENGHMVTIARSESPWGPFVGHPDNPILSHRSIASAIQSTGHADFIELADGSWWAVLLGTRPVKNWHHLGRETFLTPVTWGDDAWPQLGEGGRVLLTHDRPALTASVARGDVRDETSHVREEFDSPVLGLEWNTLRRPLGVHSSLTERPGWLVLAGRDAGTDNLDLAFVGRRQQHFSLTASTLIEVTADSREAGLIVRMDERHHYEIFVADREDGRHVVFRRQVGDLVSEQSTQVEYGPIVLEVAADEKAYEFSYRLDGSDATHAFPPADARYLSTEVAGGFTGVFIGLFCSGVGSTASFDWFDYRGF